MNLVIQFIANASTRPFLKRIKHPIKRYKWCVVLLFVTNKHLLTL
jgi:hypothetical protein